MTEKDFIIIVVIIAAYTCRLHEGLLELFYNNCNKMSKLNVDNDRSMANFFRQKRERLKSTWSV